MLTKQPSDYDTLSTCKSLTSHAVHKEEAQLKMRCEHQLGRLQGADLGSFQLGDLRAARKGRENVQAMPSAAATGLGAAFELAVLENKFLSTALP